MSLPFSASGMNFDCTNVGRTNPLRPIAFVIRLSSPKLCVWNVTSSLSAADDDDDDDDAPLRAGAPVAMVRV